MKKYLPALIALLVIVLGAYFYATRPIALAPVDTSNEQATNATSTAASQKVYVVDPANSKAEFRIGEILNGKPFEVVGVSNQVTGQLVIDTKDPSKSTMSTVRVNAQVFKTDSERRDSAIARFILKSEDPVNQFVVFEPSAVTTGTLAPLAVGVPHTFTLLGKLTVAGVSKDALFSVKLTEQASGDIVGTASGTLNRADYNLVIPKVPFVASADEQVRMNFTFTLKKQ